MQAFYSDVWLSAMPSRQVLARIYDGFTPEYLKINFESDVLLGENKRVKCSAKESDLIVFNTCFEILVGSQYVGIGVVVYVVPNLNYYLLPVFCNISSLPVQLYNRLKLLSRLQDNLFANAYRGSSHVPFPFSRRF
jgi:hypothetical protein